MKKRSKLTKWLVLGMMSIVVIGSIYVLWRRTRVPNKIVFVSKTIQEEYVFWETIKMGAELAAKEEEVTFEYVGALEEREVEKQIKILEEKIQEGADIILLAATDSERLREGVMNAKKKGITLVSVDSGVDSEENIVATDNIGAAEELTNYLINLIGQEGEIIMLNFVQGTSSAKEREEGYNIAVNRHTDIMKLPTQDTEGTTESAYLKTKEVIEKYPNIKGIIGGNQYMTEGIGLAVKELGLGGKVKVVGFDSSSVIIEAIEKGIIDAIVVQKPFNMGYIGVKTAVNLFLGKKVEDKIDTGYKMITTETLYATENQKLLYPIIE